MNQAIEFYFDFASPYAWFALQPLRELAQRHGRTVRLRPMLLWAVLKARGMPPPLEHPVKNAYLLHDMQRSARYYGAAFRMPDAFPLSSHLPARLLLQLEDVADARSEPFADAVLRAYFTRNADLSKPATIVDIASGLGLDAAWASGALTAERGKTLLQLANESALAAGVWGSPYILVDDEAYFGADRLPQIERQLSSSA